MFHLKLLSCTVGYHYQIGIWKWWFLMKRKNQSTWITPLREETRNKNKEVSSRSSGSSLSLVQLSNKLLKLPAWTKGYSEPQHSKRCVEDSTVVWDFVVQESLKDTGPPCSNYVSYFVHDCSFRFRWTERLEQTKWSLTWVCLIGMVVRRLFRYPDDHGSLARVLAITLEFQGVTRGLSLLMLWSASVKN